MVLIKLMEEAHFNWFWHDAQYVSLDRDAWERVNRMRVSYFR